MNTALAAQFNGHTAFGVQDRFACKPLAGGTAAIDEWLGNPPGTTVGPPQRCWGLSGLICGPTSAAVQASLDALAALAGIDAAFGFPTGSRSPGVNFMWAPRPCYFRKQEVAFGAIARQPGNVYAATFTMVVRMCS